MMKGGGGVAGNGEGGGEGWYEMVERGEEW